jgi:hypothetical protein
MPRTTRGKRIAPRQVYLQINRIRPRVERFSSRYAALNLCCTRGAAYFERERYQEFISLSG